MMWVSGKPVNPQDTGQPSHLPAYEVGDPSSPKSIPTIYPKKMEMESIVIKRKIGKYRGRQTR